MTNHGDSRRRGLFVAGREHAAHQWLPAGNRESGRGHLRDERGTGIAVRYDQVADRIAPRTQVVDRSQRVSPRDEVIQRLGFLLILRDVAEAQ
jgi:hypothetical protein